MSINTVRNQLEYFDLLIDGKKVKCLKGSSSELIILNKALFPGKPSTGSIQIKSCFGNIVEAETASFNFSLDENQNIALCAAVCQQLVGDAISPPQCLRVITKFSHSRRPDDSSLQLFPSPWRKFLFFISPGGE
ncbi:transposon Tf2-6 polyprotein [Nephila pilipes]|uniref:Transposon Tf2-6 polyprotein n=1 Tax=Nephila pilipes TaxID=299642 RepID=A0A8X6ISR5_NEPPI|nr:transposon Tf2-6 polyprotein [Nephila pilipes]